MYDDWTSLPYVEIVIENDRDDCAPDFEAIFTRMWNGTHTMCKVNQTEEKQSVVDWSKLQQQKQQAGSETAFWSNGDTSLYIYKGLCNGEKIDKIEAINMTQQFKKVVICARRGGKNFIDSTIIDPRKEKCPGNLLPCV